MHAPFCGAYTHVEPRDAVVSRVDPPNPRCIPTSNHVMRVSCGGKHSLMLTADGAVLALGDGSNGRLGLGDTNSVEAPVEVLGLRGTLCVSAGFAHSMAVDAQGLVRSWGCGASGRLGHGNATDLWRPRVVDGLRR